MLEQKTIAAFKRADLETAWNVYDKLTRSGNTFQDLNEYLKKLPKPSNVFLPTKPCPDCGGIMGLKAVEDNASIWICLRCRFSSYNNLSVAEMTKALWREKNGLPNA